jgi:single-strand DNA-binding protein
MNKIFLIGRLTKDAEIKTTATGKKIASFSIAVNEGKDQTGQEIVQFFNLTAWERLAEIVEQYVKKGSKVAIVGSLKNRSWDKPDGTKGYATDVLVKELEILSSAGERQESGMSSDSASMSSSNSAGTTSTPTEKIAPEAEIPDINIDDINIQMPF